VEFRKSTRKNVYVLASHSHFVMENVYNTACFKRDPNDVLPGWIVGTAGGIDFSECTLSRWMKRATRSPDPARHWLVFRCFSEIIVALSLIAGHLGTNRADGEEQFLSLIDSVAFGWSSHFHVLAPCGHFPVAFS
jgi:hypothetical protein